MSINNPAGRFHALLSPHPLRQMASSGAADAWSKIIDVDKNSKKFISTLVDVMNLPWEIEEQIKALDGVKHDVYLNWTEQVKQAFSVINLEGQFGRYANVLDSNVLSLIAICDEVLERMNPEPIVEQEKIEDLREKVRTLREEIDNDVDIHESLRDYILHHISLIEMAIDDYKVIGIKAFRDNTERAIGSLVLSKDKVDEISETKHGSGFRLAIAALIIATISAYPQMKEIGKDAMALLPESASVDSSED